MSSLTPRGDDAVGPNRRTFKEACDLLVNCTLFAGLSPDERAEVVALARIRTLNAGEQAIPICELDATPHPALQHNQLMTERRVLGLKSALRLERRDG
jgi:hypothetical protein